MELFILVIRIQGGLQWPIWNLISLFCICRLKLENTLICRYGLSLVHIMNIKIVNINWIQCLLSCCLIQQEKRDRIENSFRLFPSGVGRGRVVWRSHLAEHSGRTSGCFGNYVWYWRFEPIVLHTNKTTIFILLPISYLSLVQRFFFFIVLFWGGTIPSSAQGVLHVTLGSGFRDHSRQHLGPYEVLGVKSGLTVYKAGTLPDVLFLYPLWFFFQVRYCLSREWNLPVSGFNSSTKNECQGKIGNQVNAFHIHKNIIREVEWDTCTIVFGSHLAVFGDYFCTRVIPGTTQGTI